MMTSTFLWLGKRLALVSLALVGAGLALFVYTRVGSAFNTYVNEYRKWPWRAGVWHYVSGGCGGIFNIIVLPA